MQRAKENVWTIILFLVGTGATLSPLHSWVIASVCWGAAALFLLYANWEVARRYVVESCLALAILVGISTLIWGRLSSTDVSSKFSVLQTAVTAGSIILLIVFLVMWRKWRAPLGVAERVDQSEPDAGAQRTTQQIIPTPDQIAERQLFIDRLRAASMKLEDNTHYGKAGSIAHRFNELHSTEIVRELIQKDEFLGWTMSLQEQGATKLAMKCWDSEKRSDELSPSGLSDIDVRREVSRITESFREYVTLTTREFMGLIATFEKRGVSPFWKSAPWLDVINELAADYDEQLRLMKDLRNATPRDARDSLPRDNEMQKFPRPIT